MRMIKVEVWARMTIPEKFVTVAVYDVGGRHRSEQFPGKMTFDEAKQRVQARIDLAAVEGGKGFAMPKLGRMQ